jgi:hypothetical protein
MKIVKRKLHDLKRNEANPRNNDEAVPKVKLSIQTYGYLVPIVIDAEDNIVAGHTRFGALLEINEETGEYTDIDCVQAGDLTLEQLTQFMIVDNQVAALATWDFMQLERLVISLGDSWNLTDFGDIRGFTDIEIAPEVLNEPEIKEKSFDIRIGDTKIEWSEAEYNNWREWVIDAHGMSTREYIISRLHILPQTRTFEDTPIEV